MIFGKLLDNFLKRNSTNKIIYNDDKLNLDVEYSRIISNMGSKLNQIVKHRKGKVIRPNDIYLLGNITYNNFEILKDTKKQNGGDYIGYCDNNPGQCADMATTPQCGGDYIGYCDNNPGQCADMATTPQCGGNYVGYQNGGDYIGYCDNNPGQCADMATTPQCGGEFDDDDDIEQTGGQEWCDGEPSQCQTDYTQMGGQDWCDGQPSQCQTDYSILGGGLKNFVNIYQNINRRKSAKTIDKALFQKFLYLLSLNTNYRITQKASSMAYDLSTKNLQDYLEENF